MQTEGHTDTLSRLEGGCSSSHSEYGGGGTARRQRWMDLHPILRKHAYQDQRRHTGASAASARPAGQPHAVSSAVPPEGSGGG